MKSSSLNCAHRCRSAELSRQTNQITWANAENEMKRLQKNCDEGETKMLGLRPENVLPALAIWQPPLLLP